MPLLKRAFIATLCAWLAGVLCSPFVLWLAFRAHGLPRPLAGFFPGSLFFAAFYVAVVVFPTCLLVVTPLLRLLPRTSRLWHPGAAAFTGALGGPLAMYGWWLVTGGSTFARIASRFPEGKTEMIISVLVGATFGFLVARLRTVHPSPAPPSNAKAPAPSDR